MRSVKGAVNYSNANAGEYFRGAEWNGLYSAYRLNCLDVGRSLLSAGANPAQGGSLGSMILTVSNAWPHNNAQVNRRWASILIEAGARMDSAINSPVGRDANSIRKAISDSSQVDYPYILDMFMLSSPANEKLAGSRVPLPHQVTFSDGLIKYPLGVGQDFLKKYIPDVICGNISGEVTCGSDDVAFSAVFVRGVNCTRGVYFVISRSSVSGVSCGVDRQTALTLEGSFNDKFGSPKNKNIESMGMVTNVKSWGSELERYELTHFGGVNAYGSLLNDTASVYLAFAKELSDGLFD